MGVNFRDGNYVRRIRTGKRTVKDGEAISVWNRHGRHRMIVGPKLVYLFYSTIRFLDRHVANQDEYLMLERNDGSYVYNRGPCSLFHDPVEYRSVKVLPAIKLESSKECIIIIDSASNTVKQILKGPAKYFPTEKENVHTFNWTTDACAPSASNGSTSSVEHAQVGNGSRTTFEVLTLEGAKFEPKVTLADQASLMLSVTFSIIDPEYLLVENVHDVHHRMLTALKSDLLKIGTIEAVKGTKLDQELLAQFWSECTKMKINVQGVNLLSYKLSHHAQELADAQVKLQTELKTTEENAKMKLKIANLELDGESKRADARNQFEQEELGRKIYLRKQQDEAERELRNHAADDIVKLLTELKGLGVDVTALSCELVKRRHHASENEKGLEQFGLRLVQAFGDD